MSFGLSVESIMRGSRHARLAFARSPADHIHNQHHIHTPSTKCQYHDTVDANRRPASFWRWYEHEHQRNTSNRHVAKPTSV